MLLPVFFQNGQMDQFPLKIRLKAKLDVARFDVRNNRKRVQLIGKQVSDHYHLMKDPDFRDSEQNWRQLYDIEDWLDREYTKAIEAGWKLESLIWQLECKLREIDPDNTLLWQEN